MALKSKIDNDLKTALLGGNHFAAETLRGVKAVILDEEIAQNKRDEGLGDDVIEQLLAKEVKKRNESAEIYINANRPELAEQEKAENEIICSYFPKQLSEDEIEAVVSRVVNDTGASGMSSMGQVIGLAKKELGSSADGAIIAKIVKSLLS